jgi:hypothetical protein
MISRGGDETSYRFTVIDAYWAFMKESESELLCTDCTALISTAEGTGGFWAHRVSFAEGAGCLFLDGKAEAAWGWELTFVYCRGYEWVEIYLQSTRRVIGVALS